MKVTVEKIIYETIDIDDKFKPLFEKFVKIEADPTIPCTDEEKALWKELINIADKNDWCTGYFTDEVDKKEHMFWTI